MAFEYSPQTITKLRQLCRQAELIRPVRIDRYEPGTELGFEVTGVFPAWQATVRLTVEKFVGGGFAGQVYRVKVADISSDGPGPTPGCDIEVGGTYAMKILVPPSRLAGTFRNFVYLLGFQSAFSLQTNPTAGRAAALWQKLIRRAAEVRFGDARAVADVRATFVDPVLGSCGEIIEWVDGRIWRFEVDDRLDSRRAWKKGKCVDEATLGSAEYRAKRMFMAELVELLREVGAAELARQYEWWTTKSQPNCLKRSDTEADPSAGLTAVDFKAGLALLPCLPMSPMDFVLIGRGICRGSLVQFDRGDLGKLQTFVDAHAARFADLVGAVEQLKSAEAEYRDSMIDVTHHHVRLLYDGRLWTKILDATATGYEVSNVTDAATTSSLRRSRIKLIIFMALGLIPLLGRAVRKLWGRADYRRHCAKLLTSASYFRRAFGAHVAEKLIVWHRSGRVSTRQADRIAARPWGYLLHLPLSILPVKLHRMLTDGRFALDALKYIFVRPIWLYFNAAAREQWLREMVEQGRQNHMLTDDDAERILSRIGEPFMQKYLKSLAVHVCTLPITQIVSVIVAYVYVRMHPELTWGQASRAAGAILLAFQVTPISPGSIARGLYVLYLVIRERNFKDYNIAVFLGFFKYVGYLAFPIQMTYRYPALARFMAAHWATGAVRLVPVFGEHGALLEHGVFDLFYNWPLTIRRRMRARQESRQALPARRWQAPALAILGAAALAVPDWLYRYDSDGLPSLGEVWPLALIASLAVGYLTGKWAGGMSTGRRIVLGAIAGVLLGVVSGLLHVWMDQFYSMATTHPAGGASLVQLFGFGAFKRGFFLALGATVAAAIEVLAAPAQPDRAA